MAAIIWNLSAITLPMRQVYVYALKASKPINGRNEIQIKPTYYVEKDLEKHLVLKQLFIVCSKCRIQFWLDYYNFF